jgi:hypothetical protein
MSNVDIDLRITGPLFDGRAEHALARACDDARDNIAQFAEQHALTLMGAAFRHPTGYYESQVRTTSVTPDTDLVWDGGVVYGPWLEGVGSRNFPVTSFRGYSHWRRTKELTQARAPQITAQAVGRHISEVR